ncbi:MAG: hypothetical protein ABGX05_16640 [Pirellulaceae bacterium]|jgi:hypothetical protein
MDEENYWEGFTEKDEKGDWTHPFAKYLQWSLGLCQVWIFMGFFFIPILAFFLEPDRFALSSISKMFAVSWSYIPIICLWTFAIGPIFVFCVGFGEAMVEWSKEVGLKPTDEEIAEKAEERAAKEKRRGNLDRDEPTDAELFYGRWR